MGLNDTPLSERLQIAFFGCTNAGKSSLINALTGQEVSVVSDKKGTTTDPVIKTMELGDLGPVAVIDTPGLDDDTEIGELRVKRTNEIFERADMAVIVIDAFDLFGAAAGVKEVRDKIGGIDEFPDMPEEKARIYKKRMEATQAFIKKCEAGEKPYVIAVNKSEDFSDKIGTFAKADKSVRVIPVSATKKKGLDELKEAVIQAGIRAKKTKEPGLMISDLIRVGDTVVLVIPIDESAPKGRIILPQQQVIRDVLDAGGNVICVKDTELAELFDRRPSWGDEFADDQTRPALVVTDSQVFKEVNAIVPEHIPLTSFSIVMARYKKTLPGQVESAKAIDTLKDGDTVLIAEGCTHHRQCEDIGTVKLPRMLKSFTGKDIKIETSSGHGYPGDISKYALILHCGGCMLNEQEMQSRMKLAKKQTVPITNYGMAIAYMTGILDRALAPFPEM